MTVSQWADAERRLSAESSARSRTLEYRPRTLSARDLGRRKQSGMWRSGDYVFRPGRKDRTYSEHNRILYRLRSGADPGRKPDNRNGPDLFEGQTGADDPRHAGTSRKGSRREIKEFRKHNSSQTVSGRSYHYGRGKFTGFPGVKTYPNRLNGRDRPLSGQRWNRRKPDQVSWKANDNLLES